MKTTIKKIVDAYNALGEAKVAKLEEGEVVKILKDRKAMRKYADEYDAFLKDVQEKFKPEDWDQVQADAQKWQKEGERSTLTEDQRQHINQTMIDYGKKVNLAVKEELEREVEVDFEKLKPETETKLLIGNDWKTKDLEALEILF